MDQSLIQSGFDIELLIGRRYIEYILLSFTETGSFPLKMSAGSESVNIFQPEDVDRLYEPHPDAIPMTASGDAFNCEVIINHHTGANIRVDFEVILPSLFVSAFASLRLVSDSDPLGNQRNHRIRIEVLALELTPFLKAKLEERGISEEDLLEIRSEERRVGKECTR